MNHRDSFNSNISEYVNKLKKTQGNDSSMVMNKKNQKDILKKTSEHPNSFINRNKMQNPH